ncbi:hypothetical protein C0J52_04292 [Blattella germanica]|nr:hypothetical protein C0J52_04292 [Blattella germanica]
MDLESKLSERQDDSEQYRRRQCLRIFGVLETKGEDMDTLAIDIAKTYDDFGIYTEFCRHYC